MIDIGSYDACKMEELSPAKNLNEDQMMIIIFDWVKTLPKPFNKLIWHNANEAKTSWQHGRKLKKTGKLAGVPDITCALATNEYNHFYIEQKAKRNQPSEEQLELIENLALAKNKTLISWSPYNTIKNLEQYIIKSVLYKQLNENG